MVIYDPATITDRATEEMPNEPSLGVKYLVVAGTLVVQDGKVLRNVTPGRPIVESEYGTLLLTACGDRMRMTTIEFRAR